MITKEQKQNLFKSYDRYKDKRPIPSPEKGMSNQENVISYLWKQDDKSKYSWDALINTYLIYMDKTDPKTYSRLLNNKFLPKSLVPEIKEFQQYYKDHPVEAMSEEDLIELMKNQENLDGHFIYIFCEDSNTKDSFSDMYHAMYELRDMVYDYSIAPYSPISFFLIPNSHKKTLLDSDSPLQYLNEISGQYRSVMFTAPFELEKHLPDGKDLYDQWDELFDERELYPKGSRSPEELQDLLKISFDELSDLDTLSPTPPSGFPPIESPLWEKLNLPVNKELYDFIRGFSSSPNSQLDLSSYIATFSPSGLYSTVPIDTSSPISILRTLYHSFFEISSAPGQQVSTDTFICPSDVREKMNALVEDKSTFLEDIKYALKNNKPLPKKYIVTNPSWEEEDTILYTPVDYSTYSIGTREYVTPWIPYNYEWNNTFIFPWSKTQPITTHHMSVTFSEIPSFSFPHLEQSRIGFDHTDHQDEISHSSAYLSQLSREWNHTFNPDDVEEILDLSIKISNYWSDKIWFKDSFEDSMEKLKHYPECPTFEEMLEVFPNLSQIDNPKKTIVIPKNTSWTVS